MPHDSTSHPITSHPIPDPSVLVRPSCDFPLPFSSTQQYIALPVPHLVFQSDERAFLLPLHITLQMSMALERESGGRFNDLKNPDDYHS